MSMIAGVLGALCAVGVVTFVVASRPVAPGEVPARKSRTTTAPSPLSTQFEHFALRLTLGLVGAVVIGALTRWPMAALLCGIAGFMAPSLMGGQAVRKGQLDRIEAVAAWAEMLRDTMAGSGGLEQSIMATAAVAPLPIRREVVRLAARLERDRLAPALRELADEIDDPAGDLVVAALVLAADKSPKRLGDLLGRLAQAARSEVNMRLRVEASRARTRTSVRVISTFTLLFAIGLLVFNRDYLEPYDTAFGQLVLGVIGLCFAGAFMWLARSFRFADEERFLRVEGSDA
ncbi:MAG: type II secretion system F family protein [Acidimicrobiales bacterium]